EPCGTGSHTEAIASRHFHAHHSCAHDATFVQNHSRGNKRICRRTTSSGCPHRAFQRILSHRAAALPSIPVMDIRSIRSIPATASGFILASGPPPHPQHPWVPPSGGQPPVVGGGPGFLPPMVGGGPIPPSGGFPMPPIYYPNPTPPDYHPEHPI